jgi:hypothetical protein
MEEIFNPSLIISLGPSGRKALDFSKKLLGHLPIHFLNLVDYYEVESIEGISNKLQEIIDTKLLSSRQLNKLVDLGYKIRSENISAVRLNLYLFWDVYGSELHAYEAVKAISNLNFGNIDKNQHSGASLYIIPMMEREWILDTNNNVEAIEELRDIISFISKEESMLTMDSKVYMLHCISKDGTRISMDELECVGGMLAYLNVIPSKDPPLSHFNRRLLRNEAAYKVGTIGITSLIVFKEKLLEDFSKYLSVDILRHAVNYEANEDYKSYEFFKLINYESQKKVLKQNINITQDEEGYRLGNIEGFHSKLTKDITQYPAIFKAWEEYVENQYLTDIKRIIDDNAAENIKNLIKDIEIDLKDITLNSNLKEAINYINVLEGEIAKQRPNNNPSIHINTSTLNEELIAKLAKYPKIITYLNYKFANKRLHRFMDSYKEQVLKKAGSLIKEYIEKSIAEGYKNILNHLEARKQTLYKCINNAKELSLSIAPIPQDEEVRGSLIADILNFDDRYDFYKERCPRVLEVYRNFLIKLEGFEEFAEQTFSIKLKDYTSKASQGHVDLDFFEYMSFKYKKDINDELCKWIDKGIVKSKYLLQYINNEFLEEHLLFITSPAVYRAVKSIPSEKLSNFQESVIEGENIYTNSISIIRLCLGVNIDSITSVKKIKEKNNTDCT